MPKNEVEKMFEPEEEKKDILEVPLEEKPEEVKEIDPEEVEESVKNRRHKRLQEKLQAEREANIALNARLQQISESKAERTETSDYLKSIERIYGTQSPEAIEATNLLKSAFEGVRKESKADALAEFRAEQAEQAKEQKKEEAKLDSMIEDIEDKYGVSLNEETQKGFFKYLARISPKDEDGNVKDYADPDAAWEDYSERLKATKPVNKAKGLASRGMTQSGASTDSKLQDDTVDRFMKERYGN